MYYCNSHSQQFTLPSPLPSPSNLLGQCLVNPTAGRLRVVSNFGDGDCGADEIHTRARLLEISRARVYFVRPTIAIAKIRDYSQSTQQGESTTCSNTLHYRSDWLEFSFNQTEAIPRSGLETRHQYGICVLHTKTSFCEGSSGDLVKCRLFSQASAEATEVFFAFSELKIFTKQVFWAQTEKLIPWL